MLEFNKKQVYERKSVVIARIATIGKFAFSYYIYGTHWGTVFIVHQVAVALCTAIMSKIYVGVSGQRKGEGFTGQIKKAGMIRYMP